MPPIDLNLIMTKIHAMSQDVENALETANYDKLLQSGLQVKSGLLYLHTDTIVKQLYNISHIFVIMLLNNCIIFLILVILQCLCIYIPNH